MENALTIWEKELQGSKPYLFNLAWQVLNAFPRQTWNLAVCDDNSGRLPSLFISHLLQKAGHEIPMAYLAAGKKARAATSHAQYQKYVKDLLRPFKQPRVLFITESAGTFAALKYVHSLFNPLAHIDFAIVASHRMPPQNLGTCLVGGYGVYLAAHHTYQTFEAPKVSDAYVKAAAAEGLQGNILTNLQEEPVAGEPYGHRANTPQFP
ncbi:MAG TPA: hypothetical protein VFT87_00620, partial [Candidatus Saccharimonadales bacterium]|nr:hypothetical protein [Candidatus Saccharimonadales bacterium]